MHADGDAYRRMTHRDLDRALARGEVFAARQDALDARARGARDDVIEIARETRIVQVRVRVDRARRGHAAGYAVARSRRGNSGAPVLIGCPAEKTPQRATLDQSARSGASTPSCSQMRALTVGMYGYRR